jgi:hypothetical protein
VDRGTIKPETIDDTACDLRARRFETIWHEPERAMSTKACVARGDHRHTLLRALYSKRQLLEVMVGFDRSSEHKPGERRLYLSQTRGRSSGFANMRRKIQELIRV